MESDVLNDNKDEGNTTNSNTLEEVIVKAEPPDTYETESSDYINMGETSKSYLPYTPLYMKEECDIENEQDFVGTTNENLLFTEENIKKEVNTNDNCEEYLIPSGLVDYFFGDTPVRKKRRVKRRLLSAEEKAAINAVQAEYSRRRRARETPEEKVLRLASSIDYSRRRRERETDEQRDQRLTTQREKTSEMRRLQKETESIEEAALRRSLTAANARLKRHIREISETPEEATARRSIAAAKNRLRREIQQQNETPEEAELRRAIATAENKRRREIRKLNETDEEAAIRRAMATEQNRRRRYVRRNSETPEEAATRRALATEQSRKRREMRRQNETEEEAIVRRALATAQSRKRRENRQQSETPEEATIRRALATAQSRRRRELRQQNETPEQTAARRAAATAQSRKRRNSRRQNESPEEGELRRAIQAANARIRRHIKRQSDTPEETPENIAEIKEKYVKLKQKKLSESRLSDSELSIDSDVYDSIEAVISFLPYESAEEVYNKQNKITEESININRDITSVTPDVDKEKITEETNEDNIQRVQNQLDKTGSNVLQNQDNFSKKSKKRKKKPESLTTEILECQTTQITLKECEKNAVETSAQLSKETKNIQDKIIEDRLHDTQQMEKNSPLKQSPDKYADIRELLRQKRETHFLTFKNSNQNFDLTSGQDCQKSYDAFEKQIFKNKSFDRLFEILPNKSTETANIKNTEISHVPVKSLECLQPVQNIQTEDSTIFQNIPQIHVSDQSAMVITPVQYTFPTQNQNVPSLYCAPKNNTENIK